MKTISAMCIFHLQGCLRDTVILSGQLLLDCLFSSITIQPINFTEYLRSILYVLQHLIFAIFISRLGLADPSLKI